MLSHSPIPHALSQRTAGGGVAAKARRSKPGTARTLLPPHPSLHLRLGMRMQPLYVRHQGHPKRSLHACSVGLGSGTGTAGAAQT